MVIIGRGQVSHHNHTLAFTAVFELSQAFLPGDLLDVAYKVVDSRLARDGLVQQGLSLGTRNGWKKVIEALFLVEDECVPVQDLPPPLVWLENLVWVIIAWSVVPRRQVLHRIWPVPVEIHLQRTRLGAVVVGLRRGDLEDSLHESIIDDMFPIDQGLKYLGCIPFLAHDMRGVGIVVFGEKLDVDRLELLADVSPWIVLQLRLGEGKAEDDWLPRYSDVDNGCISGMFLF